VEVEMSTHGVLVREVFRSDLLWVCVEELLLVGLHHVVDEQ